jgi:hypothetical protein
MWGGNITGNRDDEYWVQSKDGQVKYFYNPLKQNKVHCNDIRKEYSNYHVYGVVVFVRNKNVPHNRCIVGENELIDYINRVYNRLYNRCITDSETDWLSIRM